MLKKRSTKMNNQDQELEYMELDSPPKTQFNPKTPIKRSMTEGELNGLEEAFKEVLAQGESYKIEGLNPFVFFIGLLNIFIIGFILGRLPQYYWIFQFIKSPLMLYFLVRMRRKKGEMYYFMEYCWFMDYLFICWGLLKTLKVWGIETPISSIDDIKHIGFLIAWGIANGPLAWATILLSNSLILHNLEHMASLVIHLSPCAVTWSLRWNADLVEKRWPNIFGMPLTEVDAQNVTFMQIYKPAIVVYCMWLVIYLIWVTFHGRYQSPETTGQE